VVRSALWGLSGDFQRATRWATLCGRGVGYLLMAAGVISGFGLLSFVDPLSGLWFFVLGLFLEGSARQSWLQAEALRSLRQYKAGDLMSADLQTVETAAPLRSLLDLPKQRRFIFFVAGPDERVVGVVTEKEIAALDPARMEQATAGDAMISTE